MGVFDDFVDNTVDHLVDKAADPDTYFGPDDDEEEADNEEE